MSLYTRTPGGPILTNGGKLAEDASCCCPSECPDPLIITISGISACPGCFSQLGFPQSVKELNINGVYSMPRSGTSPPPEEPPCETCNYGDPIDGATITLFGCDESPPETEFTLNLYLCYDPISNTAEILIYFLRATVGFENFIVFKGSGDASMPIANTNTVCPDDPPTSVTIAIGGTITLSL